MKSLFLPRFLSLWLTLCLALPNSAFALRTRNGGLEEPTPTVQAIGRALQPAAGAEEGWVERLGKSKGIVPRSGGPGYFKSVDHLFSFTTWEGEHHYGERLTVEFGGWFEENRFFELNEELKHVVGLGLVRVLEIDKETVAWAGPDSLLIEKIDYDASGEEPLLRISLAAEAEIRPHWVQKLQQGLRLKSRQEPGRVSPTAIVQFEFKGSVLHADHDLTKVVRKDLRTFYGQGEWNHSLLFSPDGKSLAASDGKETVQLWDFETGANRQKLRVMGDRGVLAFSPDGKTLITAGWDRFRNPGWRDAVLLWDAASGKKRGRFRHDGTVIQSALSPDGKTFATGNSLGSIWLHEIDWEKAGRRRKVLLERGYHRRYSQKLVAKLLFGLGGKLLIATFLDQPGIKIWDVQTRRLLWTLETSSEMGAIAVSPDGKILASIEKKQDFVQLWNLETGRKLKTIRAGKSPINVAFHPGGDILAVHIVPYWEDGIPSTRLWSISQNREIAHLTEEWGVMMGMVFHPEGWAHAVSSDKDVLIWSPPQLAAGAEEMALQTGRETMMGRAAGFLGQPSVRDTLALLGDPGTVTSLSGSFSGVEELEVLRGMGTQTLLVRAGISMPAADLETPAIKLFVEPGLRAGAEELLVGSRAVKIVEDPEAADILAGSQEFIWANRQRAPKALFLQLQDPSALFILTERFLLVIAGQKDKLQPGAVLLVGIQTGSEGAVLFQYL